MTDRSKIGKRSVRKGKTFERYVVRTINDIHDLWEAKRNWQFKGGQNLPDVGATCGEIHLHIECGHYGNPPVPSKWRQAMRDCGPHAEPVAWLRWDQDIPGKNGLEIVLCPWDWLVQVYPSRAGLLWMSEASTAKRALLKAAESAWSGCTPVGAWTMDGTRIAVFSAGNFLHLIREIAIDIGTKEGTE